MPDDRLEHAILRPVPTEVGGPRLAYFLPESSEGVKNYKRLKEEKKMVDEEDSPEEANDNGQEAGQEPVGSTAVKETLHNKPLNERWMRCLTQFYLTIRLTSYALFEITRSVNSVQSINIY